MIKKKVLIFGCGFHGRAAFRKCFKLKKKFNVIGWIDNDKKGRKRERNFRPHLKDLILMVTIFSKLVLGMEIS